LVLHGWFDSTTAVPIVQQAAGMVQLCALQLEGGVSRPEEFSARLAQCTQLTSLVLRLHMMAEPSADTAQRKAASGPSLLHVPEQLTGLRHLTICKGLLLEAGGAWLAPLVQLTSLHVLLPKRVAWDVLDERHQQQVEEQQEAGYVGALQEQLQQVVGWPASLQSVVLWMHPRWDISRTCETCSWCFTPAAGSRLVTVWYEQQRGMARGWARPFRPCPCLPGVWELQGEVAGRNWQVNDWL
jgi:hypothetical protein